MADLLNTGVSGLLAARTELNTVSNNITNADTPGYSMQSVNLQAAPAENEGSYSLGTGVDVTGVVRQYNQYLVTAARTQNSGLQSATALNTLLGDTNNLFGGSANLQTALDNFYGGVQSAANDPSSVPVRQALLGQASALANTFHTLAGQLDTQASQVNQEITGDVGTINSLTSSIATLNQQIVAAYATGTTPNDLLDQRDQVLQQLSSQVGVNAYVEGNSIDVATSSGAMLVAGDQAYALRTAPSQYDASQTDVFTAQGADVSRQLTGGDLGGALAYRTTTLAPTQDQLGAAALALATVVNQQHRAGMTLSGQLGGDLFSVGGPQVLSGANKGDAGVTVNSVDPGGLTGSNYIVEDTGGAWHVTTTGGAAVAATGTGTAADPLVFGGLSLTLTGTPVNGDSFEILPTSADANTIQVAITNPDDLALAIPVKAEAAASNSGQATVSAISVVDTSNADLLAPGTITFADPPTSYTFGGASYSYTAGSAIQHNGWSLTLAGTPAAGDSFTVSSNAGSVGDNGNALALGGTATQGVLNDGTTSASAAYAELVAADGDLGQQAETDLAAQTALSQQATQAEQSVSGVNLDEAAANLVRYQQSYQASAQVIQTANTVFNTLLNAIQ